MTGSAAASRQPELTEAENLEYSRKATEMALQHLRDQRERPDPELMKRLGWTKQDLDAFLRKWDALQRQAAADTTARPELDDAYRSLGLRPAAVERRTASGRDDTSRELRDAGARSEPPGSYAEQFKAFRRSVSQGTP
jgi:hypothetical protein